MGAVRGRRALLGSTGLGSFGFRLEVLVAKGFRGLGCWVGGLGFKLFRSVAVGSFGSVLRLCKPLAWLIMAERKVRDF